MSKITGEFERAKRTIFIRNVTSKLDKDSKIYVHSTVHRHLHQSNKMLIHMHTHA